jgi:hypothetical protein
MYTHYREKEWRMIVEMFDKEQHYWDGNETSRSNLFRSRKQFSWYIDLFFRLIISTDLNTEYMTTGYSDGIRNFRLSRTMKICFQ